MDDANENRGSAKKPSGAGPSQRTSWSLPLRAPESAVTCPFCGEPLKRWGSRLYCETAMKKLASGWQE